VVEKVKEEFMPKGCFCGAQT